MLTVVGVRGTTLDTLRDVSMVFDNNNNYCGCVSCFYFDGEHIIVVSGFNILEVTVNIWLVVECQNIL